MSKEAERHLGQFGIDPNNTYGCIELSSTKMGEIMQDYAEHYIESKLKEVTDEEIDEKYSHYDKDGVEDWYFIGKNRGAKWLRDKLLNEITK